MASTTFTYEILTGADTVAGSIKQWANSNAIPALQILEEAQQWIYGRLRVREMVKSTRITIPQGSVSLSFPSGFQDPISLKLDGFTEDLDYVQENLLGRLTDDYTHDVMEGMPQRWTVFDEAIQFDMMADAEYQGLLVFYGTPALLDSGNNKTNFLTDRFSSLLRKTCLALAYDHRKRLDEAKIEFQLAEAAIMEANMRSDMGRRGQIMR